MINCCSSIVPRFRIIYNFFYLYTYSTSIGYTMREIKPAKNYDVVSMAKAMNDDFAPKMKELFDTETDAAVEAIKTGNLFCFVKFYLMLHFLSDNIL